MAIRGFERFDEALSSATEKRGPDFKARLTRLARAYVGFALKYPALLSLMFEAKHRPDPPGELIEASEKAFSRAPAAFAEGQAIGEVVPGDPAPGGPIVVFSALLGLVSISTDGKFKGLSLDRLTGEIIERLILGFQPRP